MLTESLKNGLAREIEHDETTLAVVARARQNVRVTRSFTGDKKIAEGEHFRLAALAMAALGQPDERNPHRDSRGKPFKVGPYISQAVTYVLHDVEHTDADRDLVVQYAMLVNVARRL